MIYFWLHWAFVAMRGLSLVATSRGYALLRVRRFLAVVTSLVSEHRVWSVAHGLDALRHVETSRTRAQTRVPGIGRWILNYWTTREVHTCLSAQ